MLPAARHWCAGYPAVWVEASGHWTTRYLPRTLGPGSLVVFYPLFLLLLYIALLVPHTCMKYMHCYEARSAPEQI